MNCCFGFQFNKVDTHFLKRFTQHSFSQTVCHLNGIQNNIVKTSKPLLISDLIILTYLMQISMKNATMAVLEYSVPVCCCLSSFEVI